MCELYKKQSPVSWGSLRMEGPAPEVPTGSLGKCKCGPRKGQERPRPVGGRPCPPRPPDRRYYQAKYMWP